jgi:hypothetical protein
VFQQITAKVLDFSEHEGGVVCRPMTRQFALAPMLPKFQENRP